jgi:hypothetical protein
LSKTAQLFPEIAPEPKNRLQEILTAIDPDIILLTEALLEG